MPTHVCDSLALYLFAWLSRSLGNLLKMLYIVQRMKEALILLVGRVSEDAVMTGLNQDQVVCVRVYSHYFFPLSFN